MRIALFIIIASFLFVGCQKDIDVEPLNFEIISHDNGGFGSGIEVISTYDNGWVKEARDYRSYGTEREYSYHPNGYLSYYNEYYFDPENIIKLEHWRDINNLPVESKYYTRLGELYTRLQYTDGYLTTKEVYLGHITTIFTYANEEIQKVEKTDSNSGDHTLLAYDYGTMTKTLTLTKTDGTTTIRTDAFGHEIKLGMPFARDFDFSLGYDIWTNSHMISPVNGPIPTSYVETLSPITFSNFPINVLDVYQPRFNAQSFELDYNVSSIIGWGGTETKSMINSDFQRTLTEEYPGSENQTYFLNSIEEKRSASEVFLVDYEADAKQEAIQLQKDDPEQFKALYGSHYIEEVVVGRSLYVVGTLRHLPSDEEIRDRIEDIAHRYTEGMLTNEILVTDEELELLDKVFFELKVHSAMLDRGGKILNSYEEYQALIRATDRATQVVGLEFEQYYSFD